MFNLRRSLHFRMGALYTGVFVVSVLALGVIITVTTQNLLLAQLRAHVESSATQLLGDYNEDGLEELRHDIQERIDSEDPERLWYFIADENGKIEFDAISSLPAPGWHNVEENGHSLLLKVYPLKHGYRLGVGIGMDRVHAVEEAVRSTFLWAILAALALGAAGGFLVSRGFLGRLERVKNALARFGGGDLRHRVPLQGRDDEFDQLSAELNEMFVRIETLVGEVQRVTSNIAHDLRTPLGRMKQKIEALQARPDLPPDARKTLDQISVSLEETLTTFSALMRIAEVELGTRRSEFKRVDLRELLEHVSSAYEAVAEESGRSITFLCEEPELAVFGDRALLMQALVNLIENAIQHTARGTEIKVQGRQLAGQVELSVADNGPGISAEERENVLKPFFKLDRSRGERQGSGLGLSLVAAVVKLHEGALTIEDNAPGTRVRLLFRN